MSTSAPTTITGAGAVPVYITRVDGYDPIPALAVSTFTIAVAVAPPDGFAPALTATEQGARPAASTGIPGGFSLPVGSYITSSGLVYVVTVAGGSKLTLASVLAAVLANLRILMQAHQKASGRRLSVDDALAGDRATTRVGNAVRAAWALAAKRWPDALVA